MKRVQSFAVFDKITGEKTFISERGKPEDRR